MGPYYLAVAGFLYALLSIVSMALEEHPIGTRKILGYGLIAVSGLVLHMQYNELITYVLSGLFMLLILASSRTWVLIPLLYTVFISNATFLPLWFSGIYLLWLSWNHSYMWEIPIHMVFTSIYIFFYLGNYQWSFLHSIVVLLQALSMVSSIEEVHQADYLLVPVRDDEDEQPGRPVDEEDFVSVEVGKQ